MCTLLCFHTITTRANQKTIQGLLVMFSSLQGWCFSWYAVQHAECLFVLCGKVTYVIYKPYGLSSKYHTWCSTVTLPSMVLMYVVQHIVLSFALRCILSTIWIHITWVEFTTLYFDSAEKLALWENWVIITYGKDFYMLWDVSIRFVT